MVKIKVSEATNIQLDHLAMLCEGWIYEPASSRPAFFRRLVGSVPQYRKVAESVTTNWAQGGPIIERGLLAPEPMLDNNCALIKWRCRNWKGDGADFYGPTPLIAGLRCHLGHELGHEVDVPEELA